MCVDPLSGSFTVGGALLNAVGAIQQGQAGAATAEYNAKVSESEGLGVMQQAAFDEAAIKRRTDKFKSGQDASIAASGITPEGSAAEVLQETVAESELDILATRYGATVKKMQTDSQAGMYRAQGKQSKIAGWFGAGASLLNGVSNLAKNYAFQVRSKDVDAPKAWWNGTDGKPGAYLNKY